MQHDRAMRRVVGPRILQPESFGQVEVELHCRSLPLSSNRVDQLEIELRAVERAASPIVRERLATLVQGVREPLLRILPTLGTPERFVGAGGELDRVRVAERLEHLVTEIEETVDLRGHL